jgi:hypothetical protein
MSLPSQVEVINTSDFTSEEVLQKAISTLEDKQRNVDAAISVLKRKLKSIKLMSQEVSWQEFQRMKSIPCSSAHWDDVAKPSSMAEACESHNAPAAPKESTTHLLPYRETPNLAS